jgi:alkylation response protein AidB-like acyl-CoA dehydrogenase
VPPNGMVVRSTTIPVLPRRPLQEIMIDFSLTPEQLEYRDAVIRFARESLDDDVTTRDGAMEFSHDAWRRCARFGLVGLPVPEEHGGQGADVVTTVVAFEALGYSCLDNGLIFSIGAHLWSCVMAVVRFGDVDQKHRYLGGLCGGDLIGVQAMTEPHTGSDAFALRTSARQVDSGWVLNGSKVFITNAPVADVFVVFTLTDPDRGPLGLTAFLVDAGTPGLVVGPPSRKMGLRTSPMSELSFDECLVPHGALLGKPGMGMAIFNHSIHWERACIMASAIGTMQRQIERCIEHATTRMQYGKPIGANQAVSHRIVDMKLRLEASRLMIYHLAARMTRGRTDPADAAMVKIQVSEAFLQNSLDAVQIHGASGYMADLEFERDVRDAVGGRIYSGTNDIQRNIVARHLGL